MALSNVVAIAASVIPTVATCSFTLFGKANQFLKHDRNREYVAGVVSGHADGNDQASIDAFHSKLKDKNNLSADQLKEVHLLYINQGPLIKNGGAASKAMWDLVEDSTIDDAKRANIVITFMFNQENWIRGSCVFLWKSYMKNNLFDLLPTSNSNQDVKDSESKSEEKMEPKSELELKLEEDASTEDAVQATTMDNRLEVLEKAKKSRPLTDEETKEQSYLAQKIKDITSENYDRIAFRR